MKDYWKHCDPQNLPVLIGDPGCAMKLAEKQFELLQIVNAAGSAINIAASMGNSISDRRIVAVTDDKSFFHSGVSALIDCCFSSANLLLIIFDTQRAVQAKSRAAHRENPAPISIKKIIAGIGVDFVRVIKSNNLTAFEQALFDGMSYSGLAVIIIENKCTL
jgi:indolepyruvate ferredoxin oxidoreductase alpha subunit